MSWALTVAVTLVLVGYLLYLGYLGSVNVTTIERLKRAKWRKEHPREKLRNAYDRGFIENWKEVLFPEPVKSHPPVQSLPTETRDASRKREDGTDRKTVDISQS
jgi:hypothetical protein